MRKRSASRSLKRSAERKKEATFSFEDGRFSFDNGDIYNGGYKLHRGQILLVKQGKGVYTTDDFDVYDGEWNNDGIADSDVHIRYNNDAQYRGRIDSNGTMNGPGTYIFPDESSIEANWLNNKPTTNITFREPLGFMWIVQNELEDTLYQICCQSNKKYCNGRFCKNLLDRFDYPGKEIFLIKNDCNCRKSRFPVGTTFGTNCLARMTPNLWTKLIRYRLANQRI